MTIFLILIGYYNYRRLKQTKCTRA
jgi:hypothetical protein